MTQSDDRLAIKEAGELETVVGPVRHIPAADEDDLPGPCTETLGDNGSAGSRILTDELYGRRGSTIGKDQRKAVRHSCQARWERVDREAAGRDACESNIELVDSREGVQHALVDAKGSGNNALPEQSDEPP